MRRNTLNIGIALIIGIMLLGLTGCNEKNENDIDKINNVTTPDVSNEKNNDSNQQNNIKNETNLSKSEDKKANKKEDAKQTNQINETNVAENENQSVEQNETIETTQKKATFNVGDYVLHYGEYTGSGTKPIDTNIVNATITINLKEDGTYTYTSTNQEVSKDRSGTYKIKNNHIIVLNDSEPLEYTVMGDDYLVELQGSGFSFFYQEN